MDAMRSELTCTLCGKLFEEPQSLPCSHIFCWPCISNALQGKGVYKNECPLKHCKQPVYIRDLKTNNTIANVVNQFKVLCSEASLRQFSDTAAKETSRTGTHNSAEATVAWRHDVPSGVDHCLPETESDGTALCTEESQPIEIPGDSIGGERWTAQQEALGTPGTQECCRLEEEILEMEAEVTDIDSTLRKLGYSAPQSPLHAICPNDRACSPSKPALHVVAASLGQPLPGASPCKRKSDHSGCTPERFTFPRVAPQALAEEPLAAEMAPRGMPSPEQGDRPCGRATPCAADLIGAGDDSTSSRLSSRQPGPALITALNALQAGQQLGGLNVTQLRAIFRCVHGAAPPRQQPVASLRRKLSVLDQEVVLQALQAAAREIPSVSTDPATSASPLVDAITDVGAGTESTNARMEEDPQEYEGDIKNASKSTSGGSSGVPHQLAGTKCVLLPTGLAREEMQLLHKCALRMCCEVVYEHSPEVTHVIVHAVDQVIKKRSMKYFRGIAAHLWILSFDWVSDSLASGQWCAETDYVVRDELPGGVLVQGASVSRSMISESGAKLFAGVHFVFAGKFGSKYEYSEAEIKVLLLQLGGRITEVSTGRHLRDVIAREAAHDAPLR
ncbi:hypothetical protein CYMTET_9980 [Cymbomonas tetramitiformis]|uniref:RING-type E3 ubiquitin transferase BRCA1 n=1 Tax=Cymbomonas tetramitiformis TaxID=36881 RepID=A0AAE0LEL3_9CHLO|nr:hypothetical protein CYMTET_9980 [Cymbomonas tetramitiformis]